MSALDLTTVHYATIVYWWGDTVMWDDDYHDRVDAAVQKTLAAKLAEYPSVVEHCDFRCQFEGVCVCGEVASDVEAVGKALLSSLARFKHLQLQDA